MSPVVVGGVDTDQANTHEYLDLLFGTADTGFLPVWTLEDKTTAWFAVTDLADAAAYFAEQSRFGHNVYFGMGIQAAPLGPHRRGEAATVIAIACAWDDLDIAGPAFNTGQAFGYTPAGGTGVAVRTLLGLAEELAGE